MSFETPEMLQENVYRIRGRGKGSHSYLVIGSRGNALIDSGLDSNFSYLKESLASLGIKVRDIDIVINTHEHFDHIGANRYFQENAIIAAHSFAANKMAFNDRFVTLYKSGDINELNMHVHLWLESKSRIDLGSFVLDVIHTPGHTSGSICIYDPEKKIIFTGDTLFAGGVLPYIAESGSVGDYINSLNSLSTRKIKYVYPGHGDVSGDSEGDLLKGVENAFELLKKDEEVNVTFSSSAV